MVRTLSWVAAGVLSTCAAYELALIFGAAHIGREPGDSAFGADVVAGTAFLTMVAAMVVAGLAATRIERAAALLAPAAALYVTAFLFTDDPYYAPLERRYTDGNASVAWILTVLAASLAAGALTARWPRRGAAATMLMLVVCIGTALIGGDGH